MPRVFAIAAYGKFSHAFFLKYLDQNSHYKYFFTCTVAPSPPFLWIQHAHMQETFIQSNCTNSFSQLVRNPAKQCTSTLFSSISSVFMFQYFICFSFYMFCVSIALGFLLPSSLWKLKWHFLPIPTKMLLLSMSF